MRTLPRLGLLCVAAVAASGCATLQQMQDPKARQAAKYREQHATFRSQEGWRELTYRHSDLLAKATAQNSTVEISLKEQRGLLLVDGGIAMDFPVATGKASHPTPQGSYEILEKKKDHKSNLYGRMVSGEGQTVVSDADTRSHAVMFRGDRLRTVASGSSAKWPCNCLKFSIWDRASQSISTRRPSARPRMKKK
jgi:hypothetical protein